MLKFIVAQNGCKTLPNIHKTSMYNICIYVYMYTHACSLTICTHYHKAHCWTQHVNSSAWITAQLTPTHSTPWSKNKHWRHPQRNTYKTCWMLWPWSRVSVSPLSVSSKLTEWSVATGDQRKQWPRVITRHSWIIPASILAEIWPKLVSNLAFYTQSTIAVISGCMFLW